MMSIARKMPMLCQIGLLLLLLIYSGTGLRCQDGKMGRCSCDKHSDPMILNCPAGVLSNKISIKVIKTKSAEISCKSTATVSDVENYLGEIYKKMFPLVSISFPFVLY